MNEDIWEWLRSCRACEKPHKWRWQCSKLDHPNHEWPHRTTCEGGTWASPDDGHAYDTRLPLHQFDALKAEYQNARRPQHENV